MTILLIEDNPSIQLLLQELLLKDKTVPISLLLAGTLAEGIEVFKCVLPEIILLDLNLPDCRGIETARKITDFLASSYPSSASVIVISGDFDYRKEIERMGIEFWEKTADTWRRLPMRLIREAMAYASGPIKNG